MRDPYTVLGVARTASAAEIKSAFRKLAKTCHPDTNKTDPKAQERFSEISRAYDIIGDKDKRARYDRGEIDEDGREKAQFHGNPFTGADGFEYRTRRSPGGGAGGFDPEDILKSMFGGGRAASGFEDLFGDPPPRRHQRAEPQKGRDIEIDLAVTVDDVLAADKVKLKLPDGRTIALKLPQGAEPGQVIRLKGQGQAGPAGHRGDVLVKLSVRPSNGMRVEGTTLVRDVDIALETAVRGGKVTVETPKGKVAVKVDPWTTSGHTLRLKGRGLTNAKGVAGDLLVVLRIALDESDRARLEQLYKAGTAAN